MVLAVPFPLKKNKKTIVVAIEYALIENAEKDEEQSSCSFLELCCDSGDKTVTLILLQRRDYFYRSFDFLPLSYSGRLHTRRTTHTLLIQHRPRGRQSVLLTLSV